MMGFYICHKTDIKSNKSNFIYMQGQQCDCDVLQGEKYDYFKWFKEYKKYIDRFINCFFVYDTS